MFMQDAAYTAQNLVSLSPILLLHGMHPPLYRFRHAYHDMIHVYSWRHGYWLHCIEACHILKAMQHRNHLVLSCAKLNIPH